MEKKAYLMPQLKVLMFKEPLMQIGSSPVDEDPITDPDDELSKEGLPIPKSVWDD